MKVNPSMGWSESNYYRQRRFVDLKSGKIRVIEEPCTSFEAYLQMAIDREKIRQHDAERGMTGGETQRR